jgi:hypothetical protein
MDHEKSKLFHKPNWLGCRRTVPANVIARLQNPRQKTTANEISSGAPERSGGQASTRSVMGRPLKRPVSRDQVKTCSFALVVRLGVHTGTLPQFDAQAFYGLAYVCHSGAVLHPASYATPNGRWLTGEIDCCRLVAKLGGT